MLGKIAAGEVWSSHTSVVYLTGGDDQIADVDRQSRRLHQEIPQSEFTILPGLGHMVHHLAPDQVIKAIDRAPIGGCGLSRSAGSGPASYLGG